jgi:hypothetical protein
VTAAGAVSVALDFAASKRCWRFGPDVTGLASTCITEMNMPHRELNVQGIEDDVVNGELNARAHLLDGRMLTGAKWLTIAFAREAVITKAKCAAGFDDDDRPALYRNDGAFLGAMKRLEARYANLFGLPSAYLAPLDWLAASSSEGSWSVEESIFSERFPSPVSMRFRCQASMRARKP